MRPLIGVTPDEGSSNARPGRPALLRYELKESYTDAVHRAGGLPIILPYAAEEDALQQYLDGLQGLVVTGGAFDVPPDEYGAVPSPHLGATNPRRTRFERRLMEGALARGLPVLGICGGMQLLNVVRGGTLVQDIVHELPQVGSHEQAHDPREQGHRVIVTAGSRLARTTGVAELGVNSTHHQAVATLGRDLVITGKSTDGVVEAIEGTGTSYVFGVQWHPELLADSANGGIFTDFVAACRSGLRTST